MKIWISKEKKSMIPPPLLYLTICTYFLLLLPYLSIFLCIYCLCCIHLSVPTSSSCLSNYLSIYCSMIYTSICTYLLLLSIYLTLLSLYLLFQGGVHLSVPKSIQTSEDLDCRHLEFPVFKLPEDFSFFFGRVSTN